MINKNLAKIGFLIVAALFAGCGGRSEIKGELVPIERVCKFDRKQTVAVEGFLAPNTMRCERVRGKKSSGIIGCTFNVYADDKQTGASIPVYVLASSWMSGKNNRLGDPASYTGDLQFYDNQGNPLPKKHLEIYDNDGNLIPAGSKIRVYGQLPDSDKCEFGMAQRIEVVKGGLAWRNTEKNYRSFMMESF